MLRERVSRDIHVFVSELYAQVTAGAIMTKEGVILVDTMPFPVESREMASFVAESSRDGARYVILTHYHADHSYGTCFFPQGKVVSHERCRELLVRVGAPALENAKLEQPELEDISTCLPGVTFDGADMALQLGGRVVRLIHAPGHSTDMIMAFVEDVRVLFAGDLVMPVPSVADGNVEVLRSSLKEVLDLAVENLVQGHGEVILRGEVKDVVRISLDYLEAIEEKVRRACARGDDRSTLLPSNIEDYGLSRVPLNGLVQQIHMANLLALYDRIKPRFSDA